MSPAERAALVAAGMRTVDDLASSVEGIPGGTFAQLRRQAVLQCRLGELPNAPAYEVARAGGRTSGETHACTHPSGVDRTFGSPTARKWKSMTFIRYKGLIQWSAVAEVDTKAGNGEGSCTVR